MTTHSTTEHGTGMAAACPDPMPGEGAAVNRLNWYCIHAKPRKESRVAEHLRATLGLETYFPYLRRPRTIRRVRRVVSEPLFPRYLFCRFDFQQGCRAVRYAPDVSAIVNFGGITAVVDETLIEGIKSWAGDGIDAIDLEPTLHSGDPVVVTDGPLRGLEGVISGEIDGQKRVAVVLSILERSVKVTISRWQISPAA
jgi:transcriptional antiterminator RfaH